MRPRPWAPPVISATLSLISNNLVMKQRPSLISPAVVDTHSVGSACLSGGDVAQSLFAHGGIVELIRQVASEHAQAPAIIHRKGDFRVDHAVGILTLSI